MQLTQIPNPQTSEVFFKALEEAEQMFGNIENGITIKEVSFTFEERPSIYFTDSNHNNIVIKLSYHSIKSFNRVAWELSHEIVHCLTPIEGVYDGKITVLEEGLATYFSWVFTENNGFGDWRQKTDANYKQAGLIAENILELDNEIILKARLRTGKSISALTATDLLEANASLPMALIEDASKKFQY